MKRNRILYFTLLIMSLIFVYFYGGKVPYTLFHVVLVLPVISFIYTLYVYIRFKYTQETDKKFITKGDRVNFTFRIRNEDLLLYPYITLSFYGSSNIFSNQFQTKGFSLLPFSEKRIAFELECKYRGIYDIGIKNIVFQDLLGIFSLKFTNSEPKTITVFPRILKLDRFNIKTTFISDSQIIHNSKFEDMTTVSDIRRYSYGDSFKRIHWKLTSKLNNIMVKNFQITSQSNAVIILDLNKSSFCSSEESILIEDNVIESALAVIYYCLNNWINIELIFYNSEIINIKAGNPMDFEQIYKTISQLRFEENAVLKDLIDIYLAENFRQNNIFIFTSNLDYELYDKLYKAKFSGNEVSLIYTSPYELTQSSNKEEENILEFIPQINIDLYKIGNNSDIKTILER